MLVVLFHSATSADSPLAHVVVSPSATCAGGFFHSSTSANTAFAPRQLALCGGGIYIYIYIYIYTTWNKKYYVIAFVGFGGH